MTHADKKDYNQYIKEYLRRRYYERRDKAISLLGGKCSECGTTENLEFDHIEHISKSFDVSDRLAQYTWSRLLPELMKCQLLCQACHNNKSTIEQFGKPMHQHGTVAMYHRHGCRCDACTDAAREANRRAIEKRNSSRNTIVENKPHHRRTNRIDFSGIETWKSKG